MEIFSLDLEGRQFSLETGRLAKQASGAVLVRYGDTVVLVTATISDEPREGVDFFPLTVDYEERLYAVGRIPGGFIKREGRPTEKAILSARLTDRSLRPPFPQGTAQLRAYCLYGIIGGSGLPPGDALHRRRLGSPFHFQDTLCRSRGSGNHGHGRRAAGN